LSSLPAPFSESLFRGNYAKRLPVISFVSISLAAVFVHFWLRQDENYAGPLAILDRVFDLTLVAVLLAVVFCVGRRLCRAFDLVFASVAEEFAFSVMLGMGVICTLILCLGLAGLLTPVPIIILLTTAFAFTWRQLGSLLKCVRRGVLLASSTTDTTRYLMVLFGAFLLLVVIETLSPPVAADDLIYHLPATKSFVDQGRIFPLYENSLGNMPFLVHMLYAVCLMAKSDIATKLWSLSLTLTTATALYGFCVRFLDRNTGLLAVISFLAGAMVIEVGVSARVDVTLAGMLFLTTYALVIHRENGGRGWLWVAGLLGGFCVGIKLTAVVWLALIVLMFVGEGFVRKAKNSRTVMREGLLVCSIVAVLASPWLVKNLVWFQNPIYPFITGEIAEVNDGKPRYFDANDERQIDSQFTSVRQLDPNRVAALERMLAFDATKRPARHPLHFWDYYLRPGDYFLGDYRHYPNYAFLLVPLYIFVPKRRWLTWLLAISVVFFMITVSTTWISRFLLPIYPALALIAAYNLSGLTKILSARFKRCRALPLYILAGCLAVPLVVSADNIWRLRNLSFLVGNQSRTQYFSQLEYYSPINFINTSLAPGDRVMLLGLQMGYPLKRQYVSDESWNSTEWQRILASSSSLADITAQLKRRGITHILFSPSLTRMAVRTGWEGAGGVQFMSEAHEMGNHTDPEYIALRNLATFDYYSKNYLEREYADEHTYALYRVK
jgi:4-amino-4-deoxy-L-arabinose transferase-like glycosyltransferase